MNKMNIEIRRIDAESAKCAAELEKLCFSEPWSEKAILEEAERGFFRNALLSLFHLVINRFDKSGILITPQPVHRTHGFRN